MVLFSQENELQPSTSAVTAIVQQNIVEDSTEANNSISTTEGSLNEQKNEEIQGLYHPANVSDIYI